MFYLTDLRAIEVQFSIGCTFIKTNKIKRYEWNSIYAGFYVGI